MKLSFGLPSSWTDQECEEWVAGIPARTAALKAEQEDRPETTQSARDVARLLNSGMSSQSPWR